MAEAVFRHQAHVLGLDVVCDSAGTHGYHVGERPDPRTLRVCEHYGISTDGLRARQVTATDFSDFELILGMDSGHVRLLQEMCPSMYHSQIRPFAENDVPDPYYGDMQSFETVYKMVDFGVKALLNSSA